MKLTKELLLNIKADLEFIDFCERNKLLGFDLDKLNQIKGDYKGFLHG